MYRPDANGNRLMQKQPIAAAVSPFFALSAAVAEVDLQDVLHLSGLLATAPIALFAFRRT